MRFALVRWFVEMIANIKNIFNHRLNFNLKKNILFEKNFDREIKRLYSLGLQVPFTGYKNLLSGSCGCADEDLWQKLWNLKFFLEVWDDPGFDREQNRKTRHAHKYKKDLTKEARRAIHRQLFLETTEITQFIQSRTQSKDQIKKNQDEENEEKTKKIKIRTLLESIDVALTNLFNFNLSKEVSSELRTPQNIKKSIDKAHQAISSFKGPLEKILSLLGAFIGYIAAIACFFFGAGSIACVFLLLMPAMPFALVAAIAVVGGAINFIVNARFFVTTLPSFLMKLSSFRRITEYIDKDGKRVQLSKLRKFFLAFAFVFSVAVGISSTAFCIAQYLAIVAALPFLAVVGPLPIILAIILGVALIFVMFQAFSSTVVSFSLSNLWEKIKIAYNTLTWKDRFIFLFRLLFIGILMVGGVYSLYMGCFSGVGILAGMFGDKIVAFTIAIASFIAQIPFCIRTIYNFCGVFENKFWSACAALGRLFEKIIFCFSDKKNKSEFQQETISANEEKGNNEISFWTKIYNVGNWLYCKTEPVWLLLNAASTSLGLLVKAPLTLEDYLTAPGSVINSMAGNLVDDVAEEQNKLQRLEGDQAIYKKIIESAKAVKENYNRSDDSFNHNEEELNGEAVEKILLPPSHGLFSNFHNRKTNNLNSFDNSSTEFSSSSPALMNL